MVNLYEPKIICSNPDCHKPIWDYDEDKTEAKCRDCGTNTPKKLHPLIGSHISKNEKGHYILYFVEFGETDTFPKWEDLQKELDKLAKNEEE